MFSSVSHLIVAGGSPSTLLAVAGFCKANKISSEMIRQKKVKIVFTQSFQIGTTSPAFKAVKTLNTNARVVLIGLPVNNLLPEMTSRFVQSIGTRLVGIYDEHEVERWIALRTKLNLASELFNCPGKGKGHLSAASIIGTVFPSMSRLWVEAGDWADNRSLAVSSQARKLASSIDNALKLKITDNQFRVTIVRYLLGDTEAYKIYKGRVIEGKAVEKATNTALTNAKLDGNVLVVSLRDNQEINRTNTMFTGYKKAPFVVVVNAKSKKNNTITIGADEKHPTFKNTNLINIFSAAKLKVSGIPSKVTVKGLKQVKQIVKILNSLK